MKASKSNSNVAKNCSQNYTHIKSNKIVAKLKREKYEYEKCKCTDSHPCSRFSKCLNAESNIECDPKQCVEQCQNQYFSKPNQIAVKVKQTNKKGYGLFAQQKITAGTYLMEYIGEIIDRTEFVKRFEKMMEKKERAFYFVALTKDLFIDSRKFGNESRFINHSCDPTTTLEKWNVGTEQRLGFFAIKEIGEVGLFKYI